MFVGASSRRRGNPQRVPDVPGLWRGPRPLPGPHQSPAGPAPLRLDSTADSGEPVTHSV